MALEELRSLEVDEGETVIDRSLRETLMPLLGFAKGKDIIVFKDDFGRLPDDKKVVAYHLGRLALRRLRGDGCRLEVPTDTVAAETQVPKKSCGEYHSRLKRQKLIDKNEKGWYVPLYSVGRAATFLSRSTKRK